MKNYINYIIAAIILCTVFFVGRCTTGPKVGIEYVKGETVHDSIPYDRLVPYRVEIPAKPQLPLIPDTIKIPGKPDIRYMKVDTAQIIADYIKKNDYTNTLFDNATDGKLVVASSVQYNKLASLGYTFTPMQKVVTLEKKNVFTPFIATSYNTFGYFGVGGGSYINHIGLSAKYLTNFKSKGYEVGLNIKF